MRKFEEIRKQILKVHEKDNRRVEKEIVEYPGPGSYNPSFNLLEDNGFKVLK